MIAQPDDLLLPKDLNTHPQRANEKFIRNCGIPIQEGMGGGSCLDGS